jgi:hypothetical protein
MNLKSPLLIGCSLLVLTGCAHHYLPENFSDPYGFFSGIWHGLLFPLTLSVNIFSWILSLLGISFLEDIQIIGRPNTGLWYYVGFFLGLLSTSTAK